MKKRYWCQTCGEITPTDLFGLADIVVHTKTCVSTSIPFVEPLAVPEPTTWGESGGDEAITLSDVVANVGTFHVWMVGDNASTFVDQYDDGESYWLAEHGECMVPGDVVQAMNFLERSKK